MFAIILINIVLSFSGNVYINNQKKIISDKREIIMNNKHIIIPIGGDFKLA